MITLSKCENDEITGDEITESVLIQLISCAGDAYIVRREGSKRAILLVRRTLVSDAERLGFRALENWQSLQEGQVDVMATPVGHSWYITLTHGDIRVNRGVSNRAWEAFEINDTVSSINLVTSGVRGWLGTLAARKREIRAITITEI